MMLRLSAARTTTTKTQIYGVLGFYLGRNKQPSAFDVQAAHCGLRYVGGLTSCGYIKISCAAV